VTMRQLLVVVIVVASLLAAVAFAVEPQSFDVVVDPNTEKYWPQFEAFMHEHRRLYGGLQEKLHRFLIFRDNMYESEKLNFLHNGTAEFGVTQFSDLTKQEFVQKFLMTNLQPYPQNLTQLYGEHHHLHAYPASVDWVTSGKVTPVRNQGECGSCWAHCALGEIESRMLIKYGKTYSLSVQQLVDCDAGSLGCNGGYENGAFSYIYNAGGVNQEAYYRYAGYKGSCRYVRRTDDIKLPTGQAYKPASTDPTAIYDFVAKGPATAALDATPLQNYRSGVLNMASSSCPSINHCVLIVGYDSTQSYFKIKNTWGTTWGEAGYFRINARSCMVNMRIYGSSLIN